jgi:hypothetical protein
MRIWLIHSDRCTDKHDKADVRFARLQRPCYSTFLGLLLIRLYRLSFRSQPLNSWQITRIPRRRWRSVGVWQDCGSLLSRIRVFLRWIRLGWRPRRALCHEHDTQTYSHISGDFQFPIFNLSGGCKMALEGRLKRVNVGTPERAAGFFVVTCTCRTNHTSLLYESG